MGLLSSSVSITRYKVEGKIESSVLETIANGLREHRITDIDNDISEKVVGWTSFETPYQPYFDDSSFIIGSYLVFSLRIDKKSRALKNCEKIFYH